MGKDEMDVKIVDRIYTSRKGHETMNRMVA